MDTHSKEEIEQDGAHLEQLRVMLASAGLILVTMTGEIATHCSQEEAEACHRFASDVLRPVVENIDAQVDALIEQHKAASAEVNDLEALLQEQPSS